MSGSNFTTYSEKIIIKTQNIGNRACNTSYALPYQNRCITVGLTGERYSFVSWSLLLDVSKSRVKLCLIYGKIKSMSIKFGECGLWGPVTDTDDLFDSSGVYVVLDARDYNRVLDVGMSNSVKSRIENHDRRVQWHQHARYFACVVFWSSESSQILNIEAYLRRELVPLCGER